MIRKHVFLIVKQGMIGSDKDTRVPYCQTRLNKDNKETRVPYHYIGKPMKI